MYLGMPLSTKRLRKAHLQSIIDKVLLKLPKWQGNLLSFGGRLVVIKSVLSTMPVYQLMEMKLPKWVLTAIGKRRRSLLWSGDESVKGGKCLVAWDKVCRPTVFGGVGIQNLQLIGYALRLR